MRRRLFDLLAVLSLLLCAATALLWAGSYVRAPVLSFAPRSYASVSGVEVSRGEFAVQHITMAPENLARPPGASLRLGWLRPSTVQAGYRVALGRALGTDLHVGGFAFTRADFPAPYYLRRDVSVFFPCWAIVLPASVLPLVRVTRRQRSGAGRCPACGYDLRATPDRCPECGAVAKKNPISN